MAKFKLWVVVMLLLAGCAPVAAAPAAAAPAAAAPALQARPVAQSTPDPRLTGLWVDLSIGPIGVELYNKLATERDIARVDHVSLVDMLDKVTTGRRLVVFKNVSDAEQLVPHLVGKLDILGYNLEQGPSNRPEEQADPVGSARRARALADQYGLKVFFGPDRAFALSHGVEVAPYVDYFVLQVQRAQTEPQTVRDFVLPLVAQLRQVNPNLQISVQIRTEGDVKALADLVASMEPVLDGVSILTSQETAAVAQDLMAEFRAPAPVELPAPLPQSTPAKSPDVAAAILETPTAAPRRSATATPTPLPLPVATPAPAADGTLALRTVLLFGGLLAMAVIIGALIATVLIYSINQLRPR